MHLGAVRPRSRGFSLLELVIVTAIGTILTLVSIPVINTTMAGMRLSSTVNSLTGALSAARYRAIMNSQVFTLALAEPANTYVVTNVGTGQADAAVPLPSKAVAINGGGTATYTFTFCPNGIVYGSGGVCPGNNTPPALTATSLGRQINISVSSVGNVTTTTIH